MLVGILLVGIMLVVQATLLGIILVGIMLIGKLGVFSREAERFDGESQELAEASAPAPPE